MKVIINQPSRWEKHFLVIRIVLTAVSDSFRNGEKYYFFLRRLK